MACFGHIHSKILLVFYADFTSYCIAYYIAVSHVPLAAPPNAFVSHVHTISLLS